MIQTKNKTLPDDKNWHYETDVVEALCKETSPLYRSGVPHCNTTQNPRYVTCKRCRKLMVEKGIIKPEDIDNFER